MTIQIEEIRAAALVNETYSGSLNGNLADFYRTTGDRFNVLKDLEPKWLELMGYTDPGLNDKWTSYLINFGFTGDLRNNLQTEANLRHLFPQYSSVTYTILLEDGSQLLTEDGFHLLLE